MQEHIDHEEAADMVRGLADALGEGGNPEAARVLCTLAGSIRDGSVEEFAAVAKKFGLKRLKALRKKFLAMSDHPFATLA